jgi:E3 ubiquitin-protein ligase NEDD4
MFFLCVCLSLSQYLIGGIAVIDVDDWQANTTYKNCSANDRLVKWFWQVRTQTDT